MGKHGKKPIDIFFEKYATYVNPYKIDFLRSIDLQIAFNKASGCYLYDQNGKAYLDFVSGFGSNTI